MSLIDFLKRRKYVVCQESEGLNLAVCTIKELEGRRFRFKGLYKKYLGIEGEKLLELLQAEIDSMLILYRYTTQVKKYTDHKGHYQISIGILGKTGMRDKYNPLDIKLVIRTI